MLQGVTSFHDEAMATCGFCQSSSPIPIARSIEREGAFCIPSVTSRERGLMSTGIFWSSTDMGLRVVGRLDGSPGGLSTGVPALPSLVNQLFRRLPVSEPCPTATGTCGRPGSRLGGTPDSTTSESVGTVAASQSRLTNSWPRRLVRPRCGRLSGGHYEGFFVWMSAVTAFPSACPLLAFITAPTNAPIALPSPAQNFSHASG